MAWFIFVLVTVALRSGPHILFTTSRVLCFRSSFYMTRHTPRMHCSMPPYFCPRLTMNGPCGQRFATAQRFREHKRYTHGPAPLVTPGPGLLALAAAADLDPEAAAAATAVPPVPTPPQPDPCLDWSTASLPTAAPYMLLAHVTAARNCCLSCVKSTSLMTALARLAALQLLFLSRTQNSTISSRTLPSGPSSGQSASSKTGS